MIRNVILLNILLVCSLYSADLSVVMNFDCMKFEICQDNKIIKSLSFNNFYGYQIVMDKVYFIDCSDSNITEYGVVCYFDLKTQNMIYTSIKSGSAFYITNDEKIILVSSLFELKNDSAIEDNFGIKNTIIEYALNVDLYDLEKQTLIKHFDFQNFFNTNMIKDTYVNFQKDNRGNIKIIYRILDTTQEIIPGYIDLTKYIFCQYSSSSSIATNKRNGAG